jgi:putative DNA primase/helicase
MSTNPTPFVPTVIAGGELPARDEPERHSGQLRFAVRFAHEYGGRFLHAHGIGWHEYAGGRWAECRDGAPTRGVKELIEDALRHDMPACKDNDDRKQLLRDIQRCESSGGMAGVLDIAQNLHPCTVPAELLDADPYLLNTSTGTVDLRSGGVHEPRPADHLSKVTRAAFDPSARSVVFDRFLEQAQPDREMRDFLARSLGSALLGQVRDHVLHIWHGAGANGKGTLRDAVRHALDSYAVEVPADILLLQKHGQQALAPERMRLRGARVAFCSEIANGAKLDEATMKKLTGGDPVNAKLLYRNPIEFDPSHTLFMLTNHLPQVRGDDPATWRRIRAVPFDVVVPADQRDPELSEKLKAAPDAVLAWLWRGWLEYQRIGLAEPAAVTEATRKYQQDSDLLARYLAEETGRVMLGHGSVRSAELYADFTAWARAEGEDVQLSGRAFSEQLDQRGYKRKRTSAGQAWQQIMLTPDPRDD